MTDAERIADLEEQVAYYKAELGLMVAGADVDRLQERLGLTRQQARIILALRAARPGRILSRDTLFEAMHPGAEMSDVDPQIVDVQLSRARRKLAPGAFRTARWLGWEITPAGREQIDAVLRDGLFADTAVDEGPATG